MPAVDDRINSLYALAVDPVRRRCQQLTCITAAVAYDRGKDHQLHSQADANRNIRPPVEAAVSLAADWDILPVYGRRYLLRHLIAQMTVSHPTWTRPVSGPRVRAGNRLGQVCALV